MPKSHTAVVGGEDDVLTPNADHRTDAIVALLLDAAPDGWTREGTGEFSSTAPCSSRCSTTRSSGSTGAAAEDPAWEGR